MDRARSDVRGGLAGTRTSHLGGGRGDGERPGPKIGVLRGDRIVGHFLCLGLARAQCCEARGGIISSLLIALAEVAGLEQEVALFGGHQLVAADVGQDLAHAGGLEELHDQGRPLVLEPGQGRDLQVQPRLQLLVLGELAVGSVELAIRLLDLVVERVDSGQRRRRAVWRGRLRGWGGGREQARHNGSNEQ